MPIFTYKALDRQGVDHKGTIETADDHQVALLLSKRGLVVISINKVEDKGQKFWDKYFDRISFTDIVVMTRQLATMVQAGLVLSEGLDILTEQQSNKHFKSVLES